MRTWLWWPTPQGPQQYILPHTFQYQDLALPCQDVESDFFLLGPGARNHVVYSEHYPKRPHSSACHGEAQMSWDHPSGHPIMWSQMCQLASWLASEALWTLQTSLQVEQKNHSAEPFLNSQQCRAHSICQGQLLGGLRGCPCLLWGFQCTHPGSDLSRRRMFLVQPVETSSGQPQPAASHSS